MVRRSGIRAPAVLLVLLPLLLLTACGLPSKSVLGPALDADRYQRDLVVAMDAGLPRLVRMSPSGEISTSFSPEFDDTVLTLQVMQIGGEPVLLAGGSFTQVDGVDRVGVAVLNLDGTLRPEFSRLFPDPLSTTVTAVLPVPERGTVLLAGDWEDVYEAPDDDLPTTDGRYASLVEVEWPGGAVRQAFLAGETLEFGGSFVRSLARGFGESGWTVAAAGQLSVDDGGAYLPAVGAILNASGDLVAYTAEFSGMSADFVDRDPERNRYLFVGNISVGVDDYALVEYDVVPFQPARTILSVDLNPGAEVWTVRSLSGGRVLLAGQGLWSPDTGVIVINPDGTPESFSGEIDPGSEIQRVRVFPSGIYLGGTFFNFLTRDLFSGEISTSVPVDGLVRLRHDLTLDTGFLPAIDGSVTDIVEIPLLFD